MKPHKHAEVIKQWADGATIQYCLDRDSDWRVVEKPDWLDNVEYRVKPAPEQFFMPLIRAVDGLVLGSARFERATISPSPSTVAIVTLNIDPDTFEVTATTEKV